MIQVHAAFSPAEAGDFPLPQNEFCATIGGAAVPMGKTPAAVSRKFLTINHTTKGK